MKNSRIQIPRNSVEAEIGLRLSLEFCGSVGIPSKPRDLGGNQRNWEWETIPNNSLAGFWWERDPIPGKRDGVRGNGLKLRWEWNIREKSFLEKVGKDQNGLSGTVGIPIPEGFQIHGSGVGMAELGVLGMLPL